ncbi:MAG: 7TM diverse intracellular signaling domain-containing protein [Oceanicoccus sp.]
MFRVFLSILIVFLLPLAANGSHLIELDKTSEIVDLGGNGHRFYQARSEHNSISAVATTIPVPPTNPARFVTDLQPVSEVDQINGGSYWMYSSITNLDSDRRWVLNPANSIIDHIRIYVYTKNGVREIATGYLYPHQFYISYGVNLDLPKDEPVELLINFESRYFSGQPRIEVERLTHFKKRIGETGLLVVLCFGVMAGLALFNLFIGFSVQDRSYTYLSVYILASIIAWAASFNILAQWLHWYNYKLLISPFFLSIVCSTLHAIYFLELPETHPKLAKFSFTLAFMAGLFVIAVPFFSPGQYKVVFDVTVIIWFLLGLFSGVYCFVRGYKPARYFVMAFVVIVVVMGVSLLRVFAIDSVYNENFVVFLVTQTVYILVLSLAMADRISIFRDQKNKVLQQAYAIKVEAIENNRKANAKLKKSLAMSQREGHRKTEFMRTVSHELKTPLNSIVTSMEQWKNTDDENHQHDLMDFVRYGTSRLQAQIDNLVLLAETDAGSLQVNEVDFEVRPMLERVCASIAGLVHEDVIFSYQPVISSGADQLPVTLKGDPYLIESFLRLLLENACKFTERGSIQFSVGWNHNEKSLVVEVIDTGCGVSREQQKKMFNSLVKVSRGEGHVSSGLGLGLTICHRLSELLMADFTMESEVGEGTTIHIKLPLQTSAPELTVICNKVKHLGLVLLVEHNMINAQLLERLITHLGYKVDVVHSGQEALQRLLNHTYSVVLMDVQMPVMDGITATGWIRRRRVKTPIIAVAASSDPKVRRRCIQIGMNDLLVRPVRRADMQRVLERQVARSHSN